MHTEQVTNHIVGWLKSYARSAGSNGFVVGVSGGIDSAVTSALVARTGLPVICLEMPIHQTLSQENRARRHIVQLQEHYQNVSSLRVDLTTAFDAFVASLPEPDDHQNPLLPLANSRARLRMTTLYYFAALHECLVAGTGNKVEDFGVGFYTKYGDGGVDLSPIADLYKSEVYALGKSLGIIDEIMQATPTDGLWGDDRSDEDQLGATYAELEWAMQHIKRIPHTDSDAQNLSDREKTVLAIYRKLHSANQHKMNPVPVCVIPDALR